MNTPKVKLTTGKIPPGSKSTSAGVQELQDDEPVKEEKNVSFPSDNGTNIIETGPAAENTSAGVENPLEIIKKHQEGITAQLESLKTELKIKIDNALNIFVVIKKHEPTLDVSELLKPFGITTKKPGDREPKITTKITNVLTKEGSTEKEVIELLPKLDKEKIIASLNSIKSKMKPGKRDSFIYKSNKFFPKK